MKGRADMMTMPNGEVLAGTASGANACTHPPHDTGHVHGRTGGTVRLDAGSVLDWNQHTLEAIQADASTPPHATRTLAMESLAVHDVLRTIEDKPGYMVDLDAPARIPATAAVAAAAHRILSDAFPAQKASFDAELAASLAQVPDDTRETEAVAFGDRVADGIIALRAHDGWDAVVTYAGDTAPGEWRSTEPGYLPALLPQWAR
jgi:hypothetical protein